MQESLDPQKRALDEALKSVLSFADRSGIDILDLQQRQVVGCGGRHLVAPCRHGAAGDLDGTWLDRDADGLFDLHVAGEGDREKFKQIFQFEKYACCRAIYYIRDSDC